MLDNSNSTAQLYFSTRNLILNALTEDEYARLLPDLEPVKLTLGQVLYRAEEPIKHIYFLNNSMVSVVAMTSDGQCAEAGVIGYEGLVGMDALMGSDSALNETIVQHPDGALRIRVDAVRTEFKRGGVLLDRFLSFTRLLLIQIGQTALCNRLHTVEERLAKWLLLCRDRAGTNKLQLTQEFLSIMLGANRPTVTVAAITLQSAGYIKYTRGRITIIDPEELRYFSCDCYQTVKHEYDRIENLQTGGSSDHRR